jgi:hypothetical protein
MPFSNSPILTVSQRMDGPVKVEIYSAAGKLVHEMVFSASSVLHHEIDGFMKLPAGFYVVKASCEGYYEMFHAIKR